MVGVCLLVLSCSIHITKGQLVSVRNYWNGGVSVFLFSLVQYTLLKDS